MAKKNQVERVVLEDIELKPQVIGYAYKKKSNILRVIIIFVVFFLAVCFINEISVAFNNLLGKKSAQTIQGIVDKNKEEINNNEDKTETKETEYNVFSNNLEIKEDIFKLNNFKLNNQVLSFDIINTDNRDIDLADKKYFIATFNENKTLLERFKIDIKTLNSNAKLTYTVDINKDFYYIVLEEKKVDDYPAVNLKNNETGVGNITCKKNNETILYSFKNNELSTIKHTIINNNTSDENYYINYNLYQSKITSYNNMEGISATFNGTLNGYTAIIDINLEQTNLDNINEKYYYGYKEIPKVVKFEMQTHGFNCN